MPREGTHLSRSIRVLAIAGAAVAMIAAAPATAGAVTISSTSVNFGTQPVGTTSGTVPITLTAACSAPVPVVNTCPLFALDDYYVHPSATGDFAPGTDCGNPLGPTLTVLSATCAITVAFKPTGTGTRTGTLSTGTTDITGLSPGPTVALSGTGTIGSRTGTSSNAATKRKKCKKKRRHRAASSAKKRRCKKRRR